MQANKLLDNSGSLMKASGFTLVEILVVILIIGITLSFAMLSFGDFGEKKKIINAAHQFVNQINFVKKEAILESNTLIILIDGRRYDVVRVKEHNIWQPLTNSLFKNQYFPQKIAVFFTSSQKNSGKNMIVVNPSGGLSPFKLSLGKSKDKIIITITGKSNGAILVETHEQ